MRRKLVLITCAVFVLGSNLLGPNTVGGADAAAGCDPDVAPSAEDTIGFDTAEAISTDLRAATDANRAGLLGSTWDGCTKQFVVKYKAGRAVGAIQTDVQARIASDAMSARVRYEAVPYSLADLEPVFNWAADGSAAGGQQWLKQRGAATMSVAYDTDAGVVRLGVQSLTTEISEELLAKFGDRIEAFEDHSGERQSSRTNDISAYFAGDRVTMVGQGDCTTGPTVWDPANHSRTRAMTAGHCGPAGTQVRHPAGTATVMGSMEKSLTTSNRDQGLVAPASGKSFGSLVWTGGTGPNDNSFLPVAGWARGSAGISAHLSGGVSGDVSGPKVIDPSSPQCISLDAILTCNLVAYRKASGAGYAQFSQGGDSGAPVYYVRNYSGVNKAVVLGIHIGIKKVTTTSYYGYYMPYDLAIAPLGSWVIRVNGVT